MADVGDGLRKGPRRLWPSNARSGERSKSVRSIMVIATETRRTRLRSRGKGSVVEGTDNARVLVPLEGKRIRVAHSWI